MRRRHFSLELFLLEVALSVLGAPLRRHKLVWVGVCAAIKLVLNRHVLAELLLFRRLHVPAEAWVLLELGRVVLLLSGLILLLWEV